jgi:hypothetical protein
MTELEYARTDAIQEVASEILKAAGSVMLRHGDDPEGSIILAAGFAMALNAIGTKIDSMVPYIVGRALQPKTFR